MDRWRGRGFGGPDPPAARRPGALVRSLRCHARSAGGGGRPGLRRRRWAASPRVILISLPLPPPAGAGGFARRSGVLPRRAGSFLSRSPGVRLGGVVVSGRVGFCGARVLPRAFAPLVSAVVASVVAAGRVVVVGCASGADAFVRLASSGAVVLSVASGRFGVGRSRFVRRSLACVRFVVGGGPGSGLVGFVVGPCPPGVVPASRWRSGLPPSGSWSSLALAVGLGLPVVVFWCASGRPVLPPWSGGSWVCAGSGVWAAGWRWAPSAKQPTSQHSTSFLLATSSPTHSPTPLPPLPSPSAPPRGQGGSSKGARRFCYHKIGVLVHNKVEAALRLPSSHPNHEAHSAQPFGRPRAGSSTA